MSRNKEVQIFFAFRCSFINILSKCLANALLFFDVGREEAGIHHCTQVTNVLSAVSDRAHHDICKHRIFYFLLHFRCGTLPQQRLQVRYHGNNLIISGNMPLFGHVDIVQEIRQQHCRLDAFFDFKNGFIGALCIFFYRKKFCLNDILINTNQTVNRVVVNLLFFAVLNRQFQHLNLLFVCINAGIKDDCFKPIKLRLRNR